MTHRTPSQEAALVAAMEAADTAYSDAIADDREHYTGQAAAAEAFLKALGLEWLPCDKGCLVNGSPEEDCSQHGRPVAEVWGIVLDLQQRLTDLTEQHAAKDAEIAALRKAAHIGIELDNHHNAALCPYCSHSTIARAEAAEEAS